MTGPGEPTVVRKWGVRWPSEDDGRRMLMHCSNEADARDELDRTPQSEHPELVSWLVVTTPPSTANPVAPTVVREYAVQWGFDTDRRTTWASSSLEQMQIEAQRYHPQYRPEVVTHLVTTTPWETVDLNDGDAVQGSGKKPEPLGDHPHTDPGDGRTQCGTCGKWVFTVIHSCKGWRVAPGTPEPRVWRHGADDNPARINPEDAVRTHVGLRTPKGRIYHYRYDGWQLDGKREGAPRYGYGYTPTTAYQFYALLEKYGQLTEVPSDSREATR